MLSILSTIPNVRCHPLKFVMEVMKWTHSPDTLWLEFGVFSGSSINYFSEFTQDTVYGFDSFEGLPEKWRDGYDKGQFSTNGQLPDVNANVQLFKGWFQDTLPEFLARHPEKRVSFVHLDADLYSSTKYVLNTLKDRLAPECVLVFDELVNYPGFDGETGELKAWYEFVTEHGIDYEWIGMNGTPVGGGEQVAVLIRS